LILWAKYAQLNNMTPDKTIIASGNLATSRRSIMGLLGQCAMLQLNQVVIQRIFTGAGLPGRAVEEPDFPISLQQELIICMALVNTLPDKRSPTVTLFNAMDSMGIENLGLLGKSERSLTRQLGAEGTSYTELLAQVQEERAKNFLRSAVLSVAEVGYRLGYSEPAAFSRAFTQWTGVSPLKWRKNAQ
jgi:hypothetical protein